MGLLLTVLYAILFWMILQKWTLPKKSKLNSTQLSLFFFTKIAAGLLYGWLHQSYYNSGDTWAYFRFGEMIFNFFPQQALDYFQLTFLPRPETVPEKWTELADKIIYWNEGPGYTMTRFQAFIHLFSFGYYSVHVVFWSFLSISGLIYFYSSITQFFSDKYQYLLYAMMFIPSLLFWGSGLHKEGFCFFSIGLLLYHFLQLLKSPQKISPQQVYRLFLMAVVAFLLFLVRPYTLLLLLPALLLLGFSLWSPKKIGFKFLGTYTFLFLGLIAVGFLFPAYNLLDRLVEIQSYFLQYYNGESDIAVPQLDGTLLGLLKNIPQALFNVLGRPAIWDVHNFLSLIACLETISLMLLFLACVIWGKWQVALQHAFFYFCAFYAFSYLILIGLTVDNLGAIVRYRSIPLLFLICMVWILFRPYFEKGDADRVMKKG